MAHACGSTRTVSCPTTSTRRHSQQAAIGSRRRSATSTSASATSPSARRFYVDQLGFETTAELGRQALFVSAGGYHHHMAMNTWNTRGAGRRRAALGLGLVRIELPQADDLGALEERLAFHRVATADDGRTVTFDDPWLNRVEVAVKV